MACGHTHPVPLRRPPISDMTGSLGSLISVTFCKKGKVVEGLPGGQCSAPAPMLAQNPPFSGTLSSGTRGKALSFLGTPRTRALMPDS